MKKPSEIIDKTDVLIVTAVKDELDTVLDSEPDWEQKKDSQGFSYYTKKDADIMGSVFTVSIARPIDMGGDFAANLATRLVNELNPRCLCMIGICAGWRGKVFLGDVVTAERVFRYDGGKLKAFREGKERTENVFHDIRTYNLNPLWVQKAQDFNYDWIQHIKRKRPVSYDSQELWFLYALHDSVTDIASMSERKEKCPDYTNVLERLEKKELVTVGDSIMLTDEGRKLVSKHKLRHPDEIPPELGRPKVHVAPMGTGSQVREDPDLFPSIAEHVRKVRAVEMEAAAIGTVAEIQGVEHCIIAKAVSDYADHDKDDHFRFYAIEASYRFLMSFLRENLPLEDPESSLRVQYLTELAKETDSLPWANVDPDYADPKRGESVRLADIYTALDTAELERPETEDEVRKFLIHEQREAKRISAQGMISREKRLVLLGDPGSGKSTFVNYIAHVIAQAGRSGNPDKWLDRLRKAGEWEHGLLLPVRVILREFAAGLDKDTQPKADLLISFIQDSVKPEEFRKPLYECLLSEKAPCLVFFDGLDEVPSYLRQAVVKTIDSFAEKYSIHRFIVTCRIYAYVGHEHQLQDFRQATLTPFSTEQIKSFVSAWYDELHRRGRFTEKEAEERAERLKYAATERYDLLGLAERPLLLTVMALLHTFRGQLPDDRVELYKWTADLLMRRWESRVGGEKGLLETLNMPGLKIGNLEAGLYDVAFHAHAGHGGEDTADIREADLRERLAPYLNNDWNKAGEFVCYVRERAGLLVRHKPEAYTFPHRTFQEFMAACHLAGMNDYLSESAELVRSDPDRWRIVFVLAAGYSPRGQAISSVNVLCPVPVSEAGNLDRQAFLYSMVAGEALLEIGLLDIQQDEFGRAVLKRIRGWLLEAMQTDEVLEHKERVEAGNVLAKLGDPRFNPDIWHLPDDEELGFVRIEAEKFLMGSDTDEDDEFPQHEVKLSEYWIAKYPVTVMQFRAFMKDTYFEAAKEWHEYNKTENHPVVYVSWHEAVKYCEWLTGKLKEKGYEWKIHLPTEAQWEKAARGTDGRIWPWGDEFDAEKLNCDATGIHTTSPVGCFPGGASPYSIMDMAGNVWEWCKDKCDYNLEKHIVVTDTYENGVLNPKCEKGSNHILRGGAWYYEADRCRTTSRGRDFPQLRIDYDGFRLVMIKYCE